MKKLESGRSMVEMLGVLAIIGVLSIGGIAGYTLAMNRYRANNALDLAAKYAVIAYSTYQTSLTMGLTDTEASGKIPTFANAGIATLKSGKVDGVAYANATITKATETEPDKVVISMTFDNDKICQAAASTIGETCTSSKVTYTQKQS